MGIAVSIPRPNRPGGGISGGQRALQVNVRELEAMPGSTRPPFPIRPGETPSRPSRMQVAYTLNFRSTRAIASRLFSPLALREPPPPMAGEPYPHGWLPIRGRNPMDRTPPREYTLQVLDDVAEYYGGWNDDDYQPMVPRP